MLDALSPVSWNVGWSGLYVPSVAGSSLLSSLLTSSSSYSARSLASWFSNWVIRWLVKCLGCCVVRWFLGGGWGVALAWLCLEELGFCEWSWWTTRLTISSSCDWRSSRMSLSLRVGSGRDWVRWVVSSALRVTEVSDRREVELWWSSGVSCGRLIGGVNLNSLVSSSPLWLEEELVSVRAGLCSRLWDTWRRVRLLHVFFWILPALEVPGVVLWLDLPVVLLVLGLWLLGVVWLWHQQKLLSPSWASRASDARDAQDVNWRSGCRLTLRLRCNPTALPGQSSGCFRMYQNAALNLQEELLLRQEIR